MIDWVNNILPEIVLFGVTCVVMVLGLSKNLAWRNMVMPVCALGLAVSGFVALTTPVRGVVLLPELMPFAKAAIAGIAMLLLLLQEGAVDRFEERDIAKGVRPFDAIRTNRAEYYAFFMFSITGLMLCTSARDLVWLFLALELTSLPSYIMVAVSGVGRNGAHKSQEAAVKYFFLGALGAATFLYGFAMIYGGTGTTNLVGITDAIRLQGDALNPILLAGLLISLVGLCFKIAAFPMHFYTPDVYQGAAAPVSAFLAFVPKAAGFFAIAQLMVAVGWTHGASGNSLPEPIVMMLTVIAMLTMTLGNVLALWQHSVKRILAYSSVAHSGYMLVGIIAGPGDGSFAKNGLAAVLFYLVAYGITNVGAFAAVACLERRKGDHVTEADDLSDIRGICRTHPWVGIAFVVSALSLLGMPPALGFFAKLPLFTSGISSGHLPLVIVLGLNSAIAAYYYLRLARIAWLENPDDRREPVVPAPFESRHIAAMGSLLGIIVLAVFGGTLMQGSANAFESAVSTSESVAVDDSELIQEMVDVLSVHTDPMGQFDIGR
ncbi:MAG: NADH-quinone oxidoreductase subunit N [Phycisphaeraceae bacterium]|nr:NADH-quinone oxidoreductase subunit N [Phycisphaerales bacterium]MCB9859526.1 NADH-quinone oxidoreductase subunit N [Phycisphaeraceae bacterium]